MYMTVGDYECAQNLSHEVCGVIIKLWNKDARAVSVHVRHASVEVQVHCVNVVIGVVLGELHVVRVVPVVVCDDAVVRRTLVFIAFTVAIVFIVAILRRILLYWRYSVYIHLVSRRAKSCFSTPADQICKRGAHFPPNAMPAHDKVWTVSMLLSS